MTVIISMLTLYMLNSFSPQFFSAPMCVSAQAQQTRTSETRNTWKWEWTEDGHKRRVRIEGKADFTDDYRDVRDVSENGSVQVEEVRGGTARKLDVTRGANGQLERKYYVNNEARTFDEGARTWLATILLEAVRSGGLDMDKRITRTLRQSGVGGVLKEIALVSGDYAKRLHFEWLIKNGNLSVADFQSVLREASRQFSSDYEKAQLLIGLAEILPSQDAAFVGFFDATATIKSDYEHRRVLTAVLKRKNPSQAILTGMLKSAAAISSDYEKATFLLEASDAYMRDAGLRAAFLKTVETITSEHERGRVLSALLKKNQLGSITTTQTRREAM